MLDSLFKITEFFISLAVRSNKAKERRTRREAHKKLVLAEKESQADLASDTLRRIRDREDRL